MMYLASMSSAQAEALDRALARIVAVMRPEAIYLFGSRARGDARDDSDYDLLVVVPDDAPEVRRSLATTARVPRDPGVPLDIVPCRRSVFERKRHHIGTLSYLAAHEGRLVYGQ
jgi:predicted nucleotidyltransferase